jgi:hypothetical protein
MNSLVVINDEILVVDTEFIQVQISYLWVIVINNNVLWVNAFIPGPLIVLKIVMINETFSFGKIVEFEFKEFFLFRSTDFLKIMRKLIIVCYE